MQQGRQQQEQVTVISPAKKKVNTHCTQMNCGQAYQARSCGSDDSGVSRNEFFQLRGLSSMGRYESILNGLDVVLKLILLVL